MPVIAKPQHAPPAFGGRGAQIILDRGLVEQLRRWHENKRSAELSAAPEQKD
jgi:hypothetical protein